VGFNEIKLKGLSPEQVAGLLPEGLVLFGWRGSVAHGMYVPKSDADSIDDKDVMGVYVAPVENLAFGGLWLLFISVYDASWLGISVYLMLNVFFGAVGHLGVEPFPQSWVSKAGLRNFAGGSFHAQHHQDMRHNFGFYTLFWDRLLGTLRPDYEQHYGHVPGWAREVNAAAVEPNNS
jgi:hypothetical protein